MLCFNCMIYISLDIVINNNRRLFEDRVKGIAKGRIQKVKKHRKTPDNQEIQKKNK